MLEKKSTTLTEMAQVATKYEERITALEKLGNVVAETVEGQVLEKVAEMLTDNIYDIIPGYTDLETTVQ